MIIWMPFDMWGLPPAGPEEGKDTHILDHKMLIHTILSAVGAIATYDCTKTESGWDAYISSEGDPPIAQQISNDDLDGLLASVMDTPDYDDDANIVIANSNGIPKWSSSEYSVGERLLIELFILPAMVGTSLFKLQRETISLNSQINALANRIEALENPT